MPSALLQLNCPQINQRQRERLNAPERTRFKVSVRKFEALMIMHRMLPKLRVSQDVYRAAEEWAKKQLRL